MPDTKPWFTQYLDDQAATGYVQKSQGTGIAGPGYGMAPPSHRPGVLMSSVDPGRYRVRTLPVTPNVLSLGVDLARSFVVWCWRRARR